MNTWPKLHTDDHVNLIPDDCLMVAASQVHLVQRDHRSASLNAPSTTQGTECCAVYKLRICNADYIKSKQNHYKRPLNYCDVWSRSQKQFFLQMPTVQHSQL